MKKETIATIVQLVEDRSAAHAKIAELERQLAEACRDACAPVEASVRTGEGRGSGLDSPEALRESVRLLTRQRNQASYRADEMERERNHARSERDAARAERDSLHADIDAAWKAFPSHGAVRGLASLADVIEGLVSERDGLRAEIEAALRPDGWECALSDDTLEQIVREAYSEPVASGVPASRNVARKVRASVLANLRRKGGSS